MKTTLSVGGSRFKAPVLCAGLLAFCVPQVVPSLLPNSPCLAHAQNAATPRFGSAEALRLLAKRGAPLRLGYGNGGVPVMVPLGQAEEPAHGVRRVSSGWGSMWVNETELGSFLQSPLGRRSWVNPPRKTLLLQSGTAWTGAFAAHKNGLSGKGVMIGIIDTGLDVAHPSLRHEDGRTRVRWLLDLSRGPLGKFPQIEQAFGCNDSSLSGCAVLDDVEIDKEITAGSVNRSTDVVGHGTHVAGIAAGRRSPYVGVAPEAELVAVRVTRAGGISVADGDILNAVRFVFERAQDEQKPAVVNVSLGGDFGPHDGSSALEQGLAELVGPAHPGRVLVTAVGNSGGLVEKDGETWGIHTEVQVADGGPFRVPLRLNTSAETVGGAIYIWMTGLPGDELGMGLEINGKQVLDPRYAGEEGAVTTSAYGGETYAAIINNVVSDRAPITANTNSAVAVISGSWAAGTKLALVLRGRGLAQLWLQGVGDAEANTVAGTGAFFARGLRQGTVTVPATHPALIAVGCTLNQVSWTDRTGTSHQVASFGGVNGPTPDSTCFFSSAGPNAFGVPKPDLSAPGAFVASAMSAEADPQTSPLTSMFLAPTGPSCSQPLNCNVLDGLHGLSTGTSMSAPHVAGAAALALQVAPQLTQPQMAALLRAGTRLETGAVGSDAQAAVGALHIPTLLSAVDISQQSPQAGSVSADKSWSRASAGFLRPDGRSPIWLRLRLRDAAEAPSAGLELSQFRLDVQGARLFSGLEEVAPGLWQFALVGSPGTGGEQADVSVHYADQLLLRRSFPIRVDAWSPGGALDSAGGCQCSTLAAPVGRSGSPLAAAFAFGALLLWRRRRVSSQCAPM